MNPTRILPDLQSSLVCEDVRQEVNGNLIILGVCNFLPVPQVPIVANRLCILTRWTAGMGTFTEVVRFIAPDQTTLLRQSQTKFELRDAAHNSTNLSVLGGIEFKAPGVYFVEVLVDDVMKIRYPLPVLLVQPPAGAQPQSQAPAPQAPS
jgi:hypothetical protein